MPGALDWVSASISIFLRQVYQPHTKALSRRNPSGEASSSAENRPCEAALLVSERGNATFSRDTRSCEGGYLPGIFQMRNGISPIRMRRTRSLQRFPKRQRFNFRVGRIQGEILI